MGNYIGKSMKRVEDPRFIQGQGKYVANLKLPDMAYMAIKRSPYAHAVIKGIDTSAAESAPGVIAVFTGQALLDDGIGTIALRLASARHQNTDAKCPDGGQSAPCRRPGGDCAG